jgi:20S proteasome subunit beta 1
MTRQQAEAFCIEALALAMSRDGSSGGVIRLMALDKDGAHPTYVPGHEVRHAIVISC